MSGSSCWASRTASRPLSAFAHDLDVGLRRISSVAQSLADDNVIIGEHNGDFFHEEWEWKQTGTVTQSDAAGGIPERTQRRWTPDRAEVPRTTLRSSAGRTESIANAAAEAHAFLSEHPEAAGHAFSRGRAVDLSSPRKVRPFPEISMHRILSKDVNSIFTTVAPAGLKPLAQRFLRDPEKDFAALAVDSRESKWGWETKFGARPGLPAEIWRGGAARRTAGRGDREAPAGGRARSDARSPCCCARGGLLGLQRSFAFERRIGPRLCFLQQGDGDIDGRWRRLEALLVEFAADALCGPPPGRGAPAPERSWRLSSIACACSKSWR